MAIQLFNYEFPYELGMEPGASAPPDLPPCAYAIAVYIGHLEQIIAPNFGVIMCVLGAIVAAVFFGAFLANAVWCLLRLIVAITWWAVRSTVRGIVRMGRDYFHHPRICPDFSHLLASRKGSFIQGTKRYYRDDTGILYELKLKGFTADPGQFDKTKVAQFEAVQTDTKFGLGESAVSGSVRLLTESQPFAFQLYTATGDVFAMAVRIEDVMVCTRHNTDCHHELVAVNKGCSVSIKLDRAVNRNCDIGGRPITDDLYTTSPLDILFIRLTPREWASLGVSKLAIKNLKNPSGARVTVTGADATGQTTTYGGMALKDNPVRRLGIAFHTVTTFPGYSGSPVMFTKSGVKLCAGIHVGTPSTHFAEQHKLPACNVYVPATVVLAMGRHYGVFPDTLRDAINKAIMGLRAPALGEAYSRDEDEYDEFHDFSSNMREYAEDWMRDGNTRYKTDREVEDEDRLWEEAPDYERYIGVVAGEGEEFYTARQRGELGESTQPLGQSARYVQLFEGTAENVEETSHFMGHKWKETPANLGDRIREAKAAILAGEDFDWEEGIDPLVLLQHNHKMVEYMEAAEIQEKTGQDIFYNDGKIYGRCMGYLKARHMPPKEKATWKPEVQERIAKALRDRGVDYSEFVIPENSQENIEKSLRVHASLLHSKQKLSHADKLKLFCQAEKFGEKLSADLENRHTLARCPRGLHKILDSYDASSSGWTSHWRSGTKKSIVQQHGTEVAELVAIRMLLLRNVPVEVMKTVSPATAMAWGLADPRELFIKGEAHSPSKAKLGRYRLIWNFSLVDSAVEQMMCRKLNKATITGYQNGSISGVVQGMGHHDSGTERLIDEVLRSLGDGEICSCDASMWDWTQSRTLMLTETVARLAAFHTDLDDPAFTSEQDMIVKVGLISSMHVAWARGHLYGVVGTRGSGSSNTTFGNSCARTTSAKASGAAEALCNGDDMLARVHEAIRKIWLKNMQNYGIVTRDLEEKDFKKGFSFTSHIYDTVNCKAIYNNASKMLTSLLLVPPKRANRPDVFRGLTQAARHNEALHKDLQDIFQTDGYDLMCLDFEGGEADVDNYL